MTYQPMPDAQPPHNKETSTTNKLLTANLIIITLIVATPILCCLGSLLLGALL